MTDVQEKRALPPALARLRYQPLAQEFLAHAVTEDHIDHAYLFVGEPGSGSSEAAEAFAQCLVCPHGETVAAMSASVSTITLTPMCTG